jgi:hypothetical protein
MENVTKSNDMPSKKRAYNPEKYLRTRETRLANQKRYYDAHAETCRQKKRDYYAKKREAKAFVSE